MNLSASLLSIVLFLFTPLLSQAQFIDEFDNDAIENWIFFTGDGQAAMNFTPNQNFARITVDATKDQHNVWWAIIKRNVSPALDLNKLKDPAYELRVEAKVRVSEAPRRLNFMVNTQRTTNFHKQLKEYDIADTTGWHTISMTTNDLDAIPGDSLYVQLGVTDWGHETYHVDLDHYRANIINVNQARPDKGEPLPYHPPVPELNTFSNHLEVAHDAVITTEFPDINFNNWRVSGPHGKTQVLTVGGTQWVALRWNFDQYQNATVNGPGLLELTTHAVAKGGKYIEHFGQDLGMEFGKVRVFEILGGDPQWNQDEVTYHSLLRDSKMEEAFNSQMIFDFEVSEEPGGKNYITISRPVMQRLLNGTTKGLLLRPLGAINASFYASEDSTDNTTPKLHFKVEN